MRDPRLVGAAVEQIPVQDDFGNVLDAIAIHAQVVFDMVGTRPEIDTRRIGTTPCRDIALGRLDVFDGRQQRRILAIEGGDGVLVAGRQGIGELTRRDDGGRRLGIDQALVTGSHVMQVGGFGRQVDFRQGQAAAGLLKVNATADTGLGPAQQLLVGRLVLDVVILGQVQQITIAQHVDIGLRGFERDALGSIEQFVVTDQTRLVETLDVVVGGKAVEQQLVETQPVIGPRVVECFRIRLLEVLAADPGVEVNSRQQAAARHADFLLRRLVIVPFGGHFRAVEYRLLSHFLERGGRRRRGCERCCRQSGKQGDQNGF